MLVAVSVWKMSNCQRWLNIMKHIPNLSFIFFIARRMINTVIKSVPHLTKVMTLLTVTFYFLYFIR